MAHSATSGSGWILCFVPPPVFIAALQSLGSLWSSPASRIQGGIPSASHSLVDS